MNIKIQKLTPTAHLPQMGSDGAAGFDLYSDTTIIIDPGETVKIHTGLCIEIPKGYFGAIYARSGLATKEGLRPANCVGIIDSDYRGEILIPLHNDSEFGREVIYLERVAQLVIQQCFIPTFELVDNLRPTERGIGGFGSTGK